MDAGLSYAEVVVTAVRHWLRALRPKQWIKNGVLLIGILFTLDQRHSLADWLRVAGGILVFCLLASAIYLVNDLCDLEQDRAHPRKRYRPLAAGQVSLSAARITAAAFILLGLGGAWALGTSFLAVALTYTVLTVSYSFALKHVVLIDVLALAACYVLRAVAGAVVIAVSISEWLLVCATLGALLLGLAKRRNELVTLEDAVRARKILKEYSPELLDQYITIVAGSTLVGYMLYTFHSATAHRLSGPWLMLTVPFVIYGLFRFLFLMHRHGKGGDPSSELVEDRPLLVCGILWMLTSALVVYFGR